MATRTPYYGLTKPAGVEDAQISVINANMDTLDTELHLTTVRDAKNLAPIYDATSSYVEGDYVTYLVTGQSSQDANGYFVFKCIDDTTEPAGNFDTNKWEAVCITDEMGSGGGGGEGGHIFLDNEGTAMPQRAKAKFEGAYSTDNSTDGITNVAVLRTMSGIEFEQLSEAEKQGMIYVDDETTGTDDKFQPVIYSTEEREIGVWTDGKPLYEKTLVLNNTTKNTQVKTDVSNLHIDTVVDIKGDVDRIIANTPVETYYYQIPFYQSSSVFIWVRYDSTSDTVDYLINYSASEDSTSYQRLTIQYTKTTDTAGSGQWTPQGVPSVHYDNTEKVIGTWFGETLYEKTFNNLSLTVTDSNWTNTGLSANGISKFVSGKAIDENNQCYTANIGTMNSGANIGIIIPSNPSSSVITDITIQYTKASS